MASNELLEDRVRRLEGVVAALLVADREVDPSLIDELLMRHPHSAREEEFWYTLRQFARSGPFPLRETMAQFRKEFDAQRDDFARQRNALTELSRTSRQLQIDAHVIFAVQSMGLDLDLVQIPRFLPVRVYIDREDPEAIKKLTSAVEAVLRAFGIEVADDFPPEKGSWFKKWIGKLKKAATHEEVIDIARKVKRGAELAGLEKQQADINYTQAQSIATLMERAKDYDNSAVQCGTALIVVTTNASGGKNVVGVTLTASEVLALENNQELLRSPATLLANLKRICECKQEGGTGAEEGLIRT